MRCARARVLAPCGLGSSTVSGDSGSCSKHTRNLTPAVALRSLGPVGGRSLSLLSARRRRFSDTPPHPVALRAFCCEVRHHVRARHVEELRVEAHGTGLLDEGRAVGEAAALRGIAALVHRGPRATLLAQMRGEICKRREGSEERHERARRRPQRYPNVGARSRAMTRPEPAAGKTSREPQVPRAAGSGSKRPATRQNLQPIEE